MNQKIIALIICCGAVTVAASASNLICPTPPATVVNEEKSGMTIIPNNSCQTGFTSVGAIIGCGACIWFIYLMFNT
jgi:hypothetical protein